jgi:hypothetical protein
MFMVLGGVPTQIILKAHMKSYFERTAIFVILSLGVSMRHWI